MNQAHLHLLFNHFPIIVPMAGILVMIAGYVLKSETVKGTALGLFVFGAIMAIPSMATGEGAEEIAEKIPGITKDIIHHHEEMAEKFAFLSYFLGLLSAFGIWSLWKKKKFVNVVFGLALAVALINIYLAKQAGTSGGEIRHTEIRTGAATPDAGTPENGQSEDHDD